MSMRKKKVMQFITSLDDGGAETLVKDYCIILEKDMVDVCLVVIHNIKYSANYQRISKAGIRVIPIYNSYNLFTRCFNKLFGDIYVSYKLRKIVSQEKPDCIHAHLEVLRYIDNISDCLAGVNLVYTCHSKPCRFFNLEHPKDMNAAKRLLASCRFTLIALHNQMKEELMQLFSTDKVILVNNGVNSENFICDGFNVEEYRMHLGIPSNSYVVGHIGRFQESKNHAFLIDVFEELLKRKPNAFLLLIGNRPLETNIRKLIENRHLVNSVLILSHRSDIPQLLKSMDVFVFPSYYEGLSVTLIEAQVSGLRCIISDKINSNSVLLPTTIPLNISLPAKTWCDTILDKTIVNQNYNDITMYDLNVSVHELESVYFKDM